MKAKPAIENGTKVYMIVNNCLCYVTVDYSFTDDNPISYHVENSGVFFTGDDIGKTVFFNEEDAKRAMKFSVKKFHFSASWAGEYTAESREFDVESDGDTPPWEKAVKTALQLAQQNHGALNMLEYMWTC